MHRCTDDELAKVVAECRSWRAVLRSLGLTPTSAGSMRSLRARADRLQLDYTHFTGQRRWSDTQLAKAVASADNWHQVATALGLISATSADRQTLRGHALRLGLDTTGLEPRSTPAPTLPAEVPDLQNLPRAGALLAAAWFELCGAHVAWPLEPARHDLVVWRSGRPERIQVKTTTSKDGGSWKVVLCTNRKQTHTYGPEEIDQFFIIDGDLDYYLIPLKVVGGLKSANLSAYDAYRLAKPGRSRP